MVECPAVDDDDDDDLIFLKFLSYVAVCMRCIYLSLWVSCRGMGEGGSTAVSGSCDPEHVRVTWNEENTLSMIDVLPGRAVTEARAVRHAVPVETRVRWERQSPRLVKRLTQAHRVHMHISSPCSSPTTACCYLVL